MSAPTGAGRAGEASFHDLVGRWLAEDAEDAAGPVDEMGLYAGGDQAEELAVGIDAVDRVPATVEVRGGELGLGVGREELAF